MFNRVRKAIDDFHMLDGVNRVIVGLSGGADSMSLLHCLSKNSESLGITITAAHLNHMLRGEESERDFNFVVEQCKLMGVPLFTKCVDIARLAKEKKIGLEECGREERYRFFAELCDDEFTVIATAHTASDNAETVLLNITRGCGLDGICGIPPVRGNIVRPLIGCSRADVEQYCENYNIPYVTDSTNLLSEYNRNKIRLDILPTLRLVNPSVESAINRLSEIASKNLNYMMTATVENYNRCRTDSGLSLSGLRECDENLISNVIKYAVDVNFNITPERKHIELIENIIRQGHGAVELRKNMTVKVSGNELIFEKKSESQYNNADSFTEALLNLNNKIYYNNKIYTFSTKINILTKNNNKINKMLLNQCLSCDIISCDTVIRTRRSGDIFKPYGRNCTKTVKKLFNELKIPVEQRDKLLLIARGNQGVSQEAAYYRSDSGYFFIEVEENG